MNENTSGNRPLRILLATDLSSRTDRATDRAARLAHDSGGTLVVLHVIEPTLEPVPTNRLWDAPWREVEDQQGAARQRIIEDLGDVARHLSVDVRVEFGKPGERIAEIASEEGCDIIVTGIARDETLGRWLLGTTVDHLLRRSAVPVLTVRRRVHRDYQSILFATDLSEASYQALVATQGLFPESSITLVHGYHIPFSGMLMNEEVEADFRALGDRALANFRNKVSAQLPAAEDLPAVIERSEPVALVRRELERRPDGLVVVGSHGSGGMFSRMLGTTASQMLEAIEGDVLLVPDRRRGAR